MELGYDMCEDFKWMVECGIYNYICIYQEGVIKHNGWTNSEGDKLKYCPFCGNVLSEKGCDYTKNNFYKKQLKREITTNEDIHVRMEIEDDEVIVKINDNNIYFLNINHVSGNPLTINEMAELLNNDTP